MRPLTSREMAKRGCIYCLEHKRVKLYPGDVKKNHACVYNVCPYRELDKYNTYEEYLKHSGKDGIDDLLDCVFKLQRDL